MSKKSHQGNGQVVLRDALGNPVSRRSQRELERQLRQRRPNRRHVPTREELLERGRQRALLQEKQHARQSNKHVDQYPQDPQAISDDGYWEPQNLASLTTDLLRARGMAEESIEREVERLAGVLRRLQRSVRLASPPVREITKMICEGVWKAELSGDSLH